MKIANSLVWSILLMLGLLQGPAVLSAAEKTSGKLTVEQRLQRLERILRNQSLADIVLQLQQLQQEVQQLRGEVELQNHTMDALNKRQRDLYLDIDQRLSNLRSVPATPAQITEPPAVPTPEPSGAPAGPIPAPIQTPTGERPAVVSPPDPKQEADAYQFAFNLLKQGRYPESIGSFRDFLAKYPGGSYEDNAQYWLGEASYVSRDFDTALVEFNKVLEHYPTSPKVPGALLKSGYIHYEKRNWSEARELFNRLKQEFAGSTEARLAGKRLQRMDKEGH
ncbi:MAG: tol-pal system protein YbgF [Gammaproteobacteria bacterium]|nr:tol-pal system protein YbgF [Gammaproteobacteria bacterium]